MYPLTHSESRRQSIGTRMAYRSQPHPDPRASRRVAPDGERAPPRVATPRAEAQRAAGVPLGPRGRNFTLLTSPLGIPRQRRRARSDRSRAERDDDASTAPRRLVPRRRWTSFPPASSPSADATRPSRRTFWSRLSSACVIGNAGHRRKECDTVANERLGKRSILSARNDDTWNTHHCLLQAR